MSPELGDGQTPEITNDKKAVLARVEEWLEEFGNNGGPAMFSVETVEMTPQKFGKLKQL